MIEVFDLALKFRAAGRTDIGRSRRSNQDHFGYDDELGLYVVCDGMGGAAGGDLASDIAVSVFLSTARTELESLRTANGRTTCAALQRAVAAANRAVIKRATWDTRYRGMGSTLVAFCVAQEQLTVIHVGDSRAYLVRHGIATQLTEDHSVVAEQVRLGMLTPAEAEVSAMKSVITRAIGADVDVHSDVHTLTLLPGDSLLLASDGLTRHVEDGEIATMLSTGEMLPVDLCCQLIDLANDRGGLDNITALVVQVTES